MKKVIIVMVYLLFVVSVGWADTFGSGENQFTIDFVDISGATNPASGYGIVENDYRMGTLEITNGQFAKLAANIQYWGGDSVPSNSTSWFEAAQFVNCLNTSTGHTAAYNFNSSGNYVVWNSSDTGYDSTNPYRNSNAFYFLPTENEWVKAAYWNGTNLQEYATKAGQSLSQGDGTSGTGWNYYVSESATNNGGPWDVGSGSEELNGTFDMMGNMWEWMESPWYAGDYGGGSARGLRGGSYDHHYSVNALVSSYRISGHLPDYENVYIGFRVASVIPEPCTLLLLGFGTLALRRKMRR